MCLTDTDSDWDTVRARVVLARTDLNATRLRLQLATTATIQLVQHPFGAFDSKIISPVQVERSGQNELNQWDNGGVEIEKYTH